jgi:hypothetical protein
MILMNLLIALVAGLILFEPFTRTPMSRSVRFSGHRDRAKRAFAQAGVALVAAMIVATSNPEPQQVSPVLVFGRGGNIGYRGDLLGVARPALAKTGQDVHCAPLVALLASSSFHQYSY